ncbi:MAG: nicotinate phosphoribosyltransferase [Cyclobacteriaceae bacterium]
MNITRDLYSGSMALLTDLYQLTMAYGYWKSDRHDQEAVFNLFFRENPFKGGYTITCGLDYVIDYIQNLSFKAEDIAYLRTLKGNDGTPLFDDDFLSYLSELTFTFDIDAIPEGTVVFPNEPLIRVKGPILQCQLIETPLLNMINFQSLIATKASRIAQAAKDEAVLEFGLRRAQGIDGALAASRSAYIGGCSSTSNVMAGKLFGIPVSGTHAHSWVMSFDTEMAAFEAYAEVMPNNCVLLVDTYNTETGVDNAIAIAKELKERGKKLTGVRIDSGDLAYYSTMARRKLDAAGLPEVKVVASNDLDEYLIGSLKEQGAKIDIWGIGTKLVTAYDQPALGAVYKLSAIKDINGQWQHKIKLSEQSIKINIPGVQQVRRFYKDGKMLADMIFNEELEKKDSFTIVDPGDSTRRRRLNSVKLDSKDLLIPLFRSGKSVFQREEIDSIRARRVDEMAALDKSNLRFVNPHTYPVGLEKSLHELRTSLIMKLRKIDEE